MSISRVLSTILDFRMCKKKNSNCTSPLLCHTCDSSTTLICKMVKWLLFKLFVHPFVFEYSALWLNKLNHQILGWLVGLLKWFIHKSMSLKNTGWFLIHRYYSSTFFVCIPLVWINWTDHIFIGIGEVFCISLNNSITQMRKLAKIAMERTLKIEAKNNNWDKFVIPNWDTKVDVEVTSKIWGGEWYQ